MKVGAPVVVSEVQGSQVLRDVQPVHAVVGAGEGCAEPVAEVRGASYVHGGYRSFEFVDLTARAGSVIALLSGEYAASRDLLLAVAGAVRPTTGSLDVAAASFAAPAPGSSSVVDLLNGARAWRRFGRELRARGAVGLGFFTGVAEVDQTLTVEEAVARELRDGVGSGARSGAEDVLEHLAHRGLATHADQRLERLSPAARARVSVALALASRPRVAVIDLRDAFCAGLTAVEERMLVEELRAAARETGTAVLVACAEAASAVHADDAVALDIAASEALAPHAASCAISADIREGVDA